VAAAGFGGLNLRMAEKTALYAYTEGNLVGSQRVCGRVTRFRGLEPRFVLDMVLRFGV
jgi:hypothetical protein